MCAKGEPIKQWFAKLDSERIDEVFDPSISAQRAIDLYRAKGFDEKWIAKRIKSIQDRKGLTDVWKDVGITEPKEYGILTNEIYKTWSGMTSKEYRQHKGLRKENIKIAHKGGNIAKMARNELEKEIEMK